VVLCKEKENRALLAEKNERLSPFELIAAIVA
jgi:hypothetical protein